MRYTEDEIVDRITLMRELLESEYQPDNEMDLDNRLMAIDSYLSETVKLMSDALQLKGEAEVRHINQSPSKIKMVCHNEYRLVEIIEMMEKTLTKAHNSVITQISKWKETHMANRMQNNK